jgi:Tfp pilus assembly protein PilN
MHNVDFLPERIKTRRQRRRRLVRQSYLLIACAMLLALLGYLRNGRIQRARASLLPLQERAESARKQLERRADLEKQQAELMIVQRIEGCLGSRVNALQLLGELERLSPPSIALTNLDMEAKPVAVELEQARRLNLSSSIVPASKGATGGKTTVRRVLLTLTGLAPSDVDVANFIGQLSASRLFEDINMGYARNLEFAGLSARQFQASCYVVR